MLTYEIGNRKNSVNRMGETIVCLRKSCLHLFPFWCKQQWPLWDLLRSFHPYKCSLQWRLNSNTFSVIAIRIFKSFLLEHARFCSSWYILSQVSKISFRLHASIFCCTYDSEPCIRDDTAIVLRIAAVSLSDLFSVFLLLRRLILVYLMSLSLR